MRILTTIDTTWLNESRRQARIEINTKLIRLDIYDTKRDLLRYDGTVFSIAEWLSVQLELDLSNELCRSSISPTIAIHLSSANVLV